MAEGLADKIEHENMGYANPLATLIRAGLAKQQGDVAGALTLTEKALKEFEASHKIEPNRFRGLYGAALAAAQSGDTAKAKTYYEKLVVLSQNADTQRSEIKEAKAFLSKK